MQICTCGDDGRYFVCVKEDCAEYFENIAETKTLMETMKAVADKMLQNKHFGNGQMSVSEEAFAHFQNEKAVFGEYLNAKNFTQTMKSDG